MFRIRRRVSLDARRFFEGEHHPEIFPSARMLVEAPYIILYETVPDTNGENIRSAEMVPVIDGRRDLKTLF